LEIPVLFVCERIDAMGGTPVLTMNSKKKRDGYGGIESSAVDGMDLMAVMDVPMVKNKNNWQALFFECVILSV
jgi:TPP-dependent pyruvate/acetoin dehydrogenase alpha subunit